jgi:23S rRNA (pseudouridine1915-N3)-methyltransferase
VQIVVACVGRLRGPPFADDADHYLRLLRRQARIEVREVRESGVEAGDTGRRRQGLDAEAAALLGSVPERAFVCALDREGKQRPSTELARWLEDRRQAGRDLWFLVGGSFGLANSVLERADETLSLGALTLPHELARIVLLEQLFRAHKILANEPYHY